MSYRSGGTIRGPLHLDGTVSPGPSGSGSGSIYYDSATNSFRASENGGSFVSLTNPTTGGGWTDGGVSVRLTTQSEPVGIGTSAPSAGVKVEIDTASGGFATGLRVSNAGAQKFAVDSSGNTTLGGTLEAPDASTLPLGGATVASDVLPGAASLQGQSAAPSAVTNTSGQTAVLAGGFGSTRFNVVNFANLSGKRATLNISVAGQFQYTAVFLTEGVDWTAATSNNATASSLASAINANTTLQQGCSATASGSSVYITKTAACYLLGINSPDAPSDLVATSPAAGHVIVGSRLVFDNVWSDTPGIDGPSSSTGTGAFTRAFTITSGAFPGSNSNSMTVQSSQPQSTTNSSGGLNLQSGQGGSVSGNSGSVILQSGSTSDGATGNVLVQSLGSATLTNTAHNSGTVSLVTGTTQEGNSGTISIRTGNPGSLTGAPYNSGGITIQTGSPTVEGASGSFVFTGGNAATASSTNRSSGGFTVTLGSSAGPSQVGGFVTLTAGTGSGSGNGGQFNGNGGIGGSTGNGGNASVIGGAALVGATDRGGGSAILGTGANTGSPAGGAGLPTITLQAAPNTVGGASGTAAVSRTTLLTAAARQNNISGANDIFSSSVTFQDGGSNSSGTYRLLDLAPTVNWTGATRTGAYEAVRVGVVETSLGTGANYLLRLQAGISGTSDRFTVDNSGNTTLAGSLLAPDGTQLAVGGSTVASDVAPGAEVVKPQSAYSQASSHKSGANLVLSPGAGQRGFTILNFANLATNGNTFSLETNGATTTFTAVASGAGPGQFNANTDNATTAANLAAALSTVSGITATSVSNVVYVTWSASVLSILASTNASGANATATTMTDGLIYIPMSVSGGSGPGIFSGPSPTTSVTGSAPISNSMEFQCESTSIALRLVSISRGGGVTVDFPRLYGYSSHGGTMASPSSTQSGNTLLEIGGIGYGATLWGGNGNGGNPGSITPSASIVVSAAEDFTDTATGGFMRLRTITSGTTAPADRLRIDSSGATLPSNGTLAWASGTALSGTPTLDTGLARGAQGVTVATLGSGTTATGEFGAARFRGTAHATISTATTLDATATYWKCDATGGAFQATLPTAVGISGAAYTIKKIDGTANAVTVGTTSSQTIDASTTYPLTSQWQSITVFSDGSNWLIA